MILKNKDGLLYWQSEGISAPHLFTTRAGGVSTGEFASLNVSFVVGDDRENVLENINRIASVLGYTASDVVCSRQAHTTVCRRVGREQRGVGVFLPRFEEPADALITDEEDVLLLVRCADCTPILLHDVKNNAVAAIHSGWKGTLSNVIASTVEKMKNEFGTRGEDITAAIGACISACCFEVGEEVAALFENAGYGRFINYSGKARIDLKAICRHQLTAQGVGENAVNVSEECTKCKSDVYFSHRAQGDKRGLLAAVIGINKK